MDSQQTIIRETSMLMKVLEVEKEATAPSTHLSNDKNKYDSMYSGWHKTIGQIKPSIVFK